MASTQLTSIAQLVPQVEEACPGVGTVRALLALKRIFRDFCQQTGIWRETIPITSVADQAAYTLTPTAAATQVHRIVEVRPTDADGNESTPVSDDCYYLDMGIDITAKQGSLVFSQGSAPTEDDLTWNVLVSLRPAWIGDDTQAPAWLLDRFGDGVAEGAISNLKKMTFTLWNDPAGAADSLRLYLGAVGTAKNELLRRGTARSAGFGPA